MSKRAFSLAVVGLLAASASASAKEAKLVRYPHYHEGKIAFNYLGDIWTATEDGQNIRRLTAHKDRDVYPRFSPDGKYVAFSSDRNGNLDVFLMPAEGGAVMALTTHSAAEKVVGWSPDSKNVLFASQRGEGFMGKLYTVPVTGGMPQDAGPDMGMDGSYSPDGQKLAINRKGQSYWRKYYRGSYQSDVTIMDLTSRTFTKLTDFDGLDSWPMWSQDGNIYFVSDRDDDGLTNLWRVPESGGPAEKVTSFSSGDVRFPSMSADGKTIVFEHEFGIWKLDIASRTATPIKLDINAETQENLTEYREFNSEVDDYALAPDGKTIVLSVHGEVFTAPTDEGDVVQLTESADRDRNVEYSPDGKTIAFVSDKESSREEIYTVPADGAGETKRITDSDSLKASYHWAPDSKTIAFTTGDGGLYTVTAEGKDQKEITRSHHGGFRGVTWSPDGKWLLYSRADANLSSDLYLIPSEGGEEKKITFDPGSEMGPRFSADGKKVYFIRADASMGMGGNDRPETNLYVLYLEKQDKDPQEASEAASPRGGRGMNPNAMAGMMGAMAGMGGGDAPAPKPKEVKIDWDGLKRRTLPVIKTRGTTVTSFIPANDSRTLIFVGGEGGGGGGGMAAMMGGGSSIYSIGDDGKKMTRISTGTPTPAASEGDGAPRGRRGGFGGGRISNLAIPKDGRTVFFQEGDAVYSAPITGGGGGGGGGGMAAMMASMGGGRGAAASGGGGDGGRKKIAFVAKVKIDKPAEWEEMFDDAWRTMKYRFYDDKMHGMDWDAARAKYKPLVEFVGDRDELMNVINEMIGELNASHTGASAGNGRARGAPADDTPNVQTGHFGFELVADDASGYYKVGHVYEDGPADKDWVKIAEGNTILAFNGKPLKVGDDYFELLNRRLNRKVELTVNDKPETEGSWKVRIEPISSSAYSTLVYEKWVKDRRAIADKMSNGRVGYLHIKAMDQASLARFKKDLAEFRTKEALVIDQRFNGGGNIEQELLAILVQKPYQVWQPRGSEPTQRPFAGYFGPKVVLQNWRSASNAEMFPAGFRALGLGKVIGTPTMGAVIGTGSYSLIDGSTVRTPGVGVYLADQERTNMENHPVPPDIAVENTPEDNLAGKDTQLEVGVQELLKQLPPTEGGVAEKE